MCYNISDIMWYNDQATNQDQRRMMSCAQACNSRRRSIEKRIRIRFMKIARFEDNANVIFLDLFLGLDERCNISKGDLALNLYHSHLKTPY